MLDSGFCVLKTIIELKRKGVFVCALIKKQRYWPSMVPGDAFDEHFIQKEVGDTDAITDALDGIRYHLWGMKEPDFIMKMMATGGGLYTEGCKEATGTWDNGGIQMRKTFLYTKPFHLNFKYRHAVDDHNNLRYALPSVEDSLRTERWPD